MPSYNALRAFVAVAKHGNLKDAANELFVSPSALSHQIKNLEDNLNKNLFIRNKYGLTLTPAGELIYQDLSDAFSNISKAIDKIRTTGHRDILNISMLSTFAMRWFIPRLSDFQKQSPDIEIRISTSVDEVDFEREDMDCAIRSGHGLWQGLHAEYLFTETFTPVCSPKLAALLNTPNDLASQTLLHAHLRPDDWQVWFKALKLKVSIEHEQTFETRNFAIQAAIDGVGIAIVDPSLITEELKSGRLIIPFSQTMADKNAYYLVYPQSADNPHIQHLHQWLKQQLNQ